MIKIFTADKAKELDEYTILNEPIRSIDLVERASTAFVHEFCRRYSKQNRIIVFAGQGNNGADSLAIARLLKEESYPVETILFNPTQHLSADCERNKMRLVGLEQVEFTEVTIDFEPPVFTEKDIIIDGLFGSGLSRPLGGGFAAVVKYINDSNATVVSIDLPSGLFGEDNSANDLEAIIKADLTLTFGFPKLSFFFPENEPFVGEWKMLDIGLHPQTAEVIPTPYNLITEEDISEVFLPRNKFTHKGVYGHALLIAGSRGKMGAAILSAKGCMRSGAGLLTVHLPACGEAIMQTAFPEAMVKADSHSEFFTTPPHTSHYSAIAIGPGLGQHLESAIALDTLLRSTPKPIILDADALNILAANKELVAIIPPRSILTPHPKEFDRLAGESNCAYERLMKAKAFACKYKICLVLKGAYTAICTPEGTIIFNSTGNPGMATAGSGDVLTGIILGLLAQGYEPEVCAIVGVFIHGMAGNMAAIYHSEESMIAGDIVDTLGKTFKQLK